MSQESKSFGVTNGGSATDEGHKLEDDVNFVTFPQNLHLIGE